MGFRALTLLRDLALWRGIDDYFAGWLVYAAVDLLRLAARGVDLLRQGLPKRSDLIHQFTVSVL